MNFFGHATVACWQHRDPRWVLGAMLPDFASMSRARLRGAEDPEVAAGIAHHHATDEAFHGAPTFLELYSRGAEALEASGVGRGPARAVAHVGAELLLDGILLDDAAAGEAYLAAVALPREPLGLRFLGEGAERFAALHARLGEHGLPEDYRSPERVALRLEQILARRPRLSLSPEDRPAVTAHLHRTRDTLVTLAPRLLAEVRHGLSAGPRSVDTVTFARAILREQRT